MLEVALIYEVVSDGYSPVNAFHLQIPLLFNFLGRVFWIDFGGCKLQLRPSEVIRFLD